MPSRTYTVKIRVDAADAAELPERIAEAIAEGVPGEWYDSEDSWRVDDIRDVGYEDDLTT